MKQVIVETLTDEALVQAIASAQWRVRLYTPGVSMAVAQALIAKAKELRANPSASFLVALDVSDDAVKMGYGEAAAIELLWGEDTEHSDEEANRWFYFAPEIRIGLLIVDDHSLLFSPLARLMEAQATLAKPGPNGITLPYELLLKEEYQQRLEPLAKRHVSLEDIEHLTQIPTETREEMEEKVKEKDEKIEAQQAEIENLEKRVKKAEAKLDDAVREAEKKYTCPPVYDASLSLEKFNLNRMRFNIPQEFLIEAFPNKNESDIKALKAALNLSKEECEKICDEDYNEIMKDVVKLRAKYLFQVSYKPPSEEFGNKKRSAHVLFREDNDTFRKELGALYKRVTELREKYEERITNHLIEKLSVIFGADKNKSTYFVHKYNLHCKFNPRISFECNKISPEIYESEAFKVALYRTLYELSKKGDKVSVEVAELKESICVENTGYEKYHKCDGDIAKLYKLQFPEDEKSEEANKKDEE